MVAERVWDTFLTAQDTASLAQRPPLLWGFCERPALVHALTHFATLSAHASTH